MERCNKAAEGFECLKLAGHVGDCDCVTAEAFNTSMQLAEDKFLHGNSYAQQNADGTVTRLDPTKLIIMARSTGKQGLYNLLIEAYAKGLVKP